MNTATEAEHQGPDGHDGHDTATGVYHVNDREARVQAKGEDLHGREILARAGFSAEKYELFEIVHGKAGAEIPPDAIHPVKPGDHLRATIRGTDYSSSPAR